MNKIIKKKQKIGGLILFWFCPLKISQLQWIFNNVFLTLNAWNAMDVYLISVLAAGAELQRVSQWMIDNKFNKACSDVKKITGLDCFIIEGHILSASGVMAAAIITFYVAYFYTHWVFKHNIIKHYKTQEFIKQRRIVKSTQNKTQIVNHLLNMIDNNHSQQENLLNAENI